MSQNTENLNLLSLSDLKDLMDADLNSFREKLNKIGGIDGLCAQLNTSSTHGLSNDTLVFHSRQVYGESAHNTITSENETQNQIPGFYVLFVLGFCQKDYVINRLAFCIRIIPTILALVLLLLDADMYEYFGDCFNWIWLSFHMMDMTACYYVTCILVVVKGLKMALKNLTQFFLENKKAKSMGVTVIRNGVVTKELPLTELVVGDICQLSQLGNIIPGDGILLADDNDNEDPRLFAGEFKRGQGKLLIIAIGENTRRSKPVSPPDVSSQKPISPFYEELYKFYLLVIKCALIFAIVTTALVILRFCVEEFVIEQRKWNMSYSKLFIWFIVTIIDLLLCVLPESIPPAVILSGIKNLRKAQNDGILMKYVGIEAVIPKLTVLIIDENCFGLIKSADMPETQSLSSQGTRIKVLVETTRSENLSESLLNEYGINQNDCVYYNTTTKSKANIIESMTNSGEIVGYMAIGLQSDVEALRIAHVGIIMGSTVHSHVPAMKEAAETADVYLTRERSKKSLELLLRNGLGLYLATFSIFQLRLPGLFVLCAMKFLQKVITELDFCGPQFILIFILNILLILGLVYSDDVKINKPPKISTTIFPRQVLKNILFQIIYQSIAVVVLMYTHEYASSTRIHDSIVWMTLFNTFNSRKSHGECNVLRGLSIKQPFLPIWIFCTICQIVNVIIHVSELEDVILRLGDATLCLALGIGTLLVYQISIRLPFWKEVEAREFGVGVAHTDEEIALV